MTPRQGNVGDISIKSPSSNKGCLELFASCMCCTFITTQVIGGGGGDDRSQDVISAIIFFLHLCITLLHCIFFILGTSTSSIIGNVALLSFYVTYHLANLISMIFLSECVSYMQHEIQEYQVII